ncbi:MAG: ATP-binding protein, partial [Janthinobacterium lividum]
MTPVPSIDLPAFPFHHGDNATLIRGFDWAATALGAIDNWSSTLRSTVSLMLDAAVPITLIWGDEGNLIYNDAYSEFAGTRHPTLMGLPVLQAWPEVASFNANVMDRTYLRGETLLYRDIHMTLERRGVPDDIWLNLDYSPVRDDQGSIVGVLCILRDTTARVHTEQRLRIAQEAGGVGIFEWFPDTGRMEVSDEYRRIWGLPADGVVTERMLIDLLHPQDRENAGPSKLHQANPLTYAEYRRFDPATGAVRWIGRRGEVVSGQGSGSRRFVGIATDITERKLAEQAMADLMSTLEQRIEIRSKELQATQEALRHSQKMESLGKLTGGVAHDFNNLLQVISGNLQLLAIDIAGNERAERRVSSAIAGVSRGAKLASQLLSFGRRQPLEPKVVNIGRYIAGVDDMLRRAIGEAIEIETVIAGGLWNTLVDLTQIENALLNLAINGRDAMEGTGRLTIEVGNIVLDDDYAGKHDEVAAGEYVMLAVSDTGSGMSADIMEQAFEPFFSTKPEGKGTGLGLSMVYGFVKQSGGHTKIYSEVGHGTTIRIYLPRAEQGEEVVSSTPPPPVTGGSETILVAEDDENVSATVLDLLTGLGYRVLKARDAATALTVIESGVAIDLLFTDVV